MSTPRGFALLTPAERTAMARRGGAAVPPSKRSFSVNKALAQSAGSKGGAVGKCPAESGE